MYALRQIGPGATDARQRLLAGLQEENFDALAAAWALAQIAPDDKVVANQVFPVLVRGLESSDHHVRADSVEALVTCKAAGQKAVLILTAIAQKDDDPAMRAVAKEALEHINGKQRVDRMTCEMPIMGNPWVALFSFQLQRFRLAVATACQPAP